MLTQREKEIIKLISKGKSNEEIAFELKICESTVKIHIKNIMNKLNLKNRVEIVLYYFAHRNEFE